ncbi:MAG: alpha/beta hydrolase [Ktedonobacterales bacterium]
MSEDTAYPRDGMTNGHGVRLHYRDWGDPMDRGPEGPAHRTGNTTNRPPTPLLLLHGLASSLCIWDMVAPILARERRVVALDQRGHGLSDKPDDGYDFASMLADDLAAADALGLGERFAVAGHSWGANVALEFAAMHSDRVAAMALVDGGFGMLRQRPGATWEQLSRDLAPPDFAGTPRETFLGWVHDEIPNWRPDIDEIELNIVELRPDDTVRPRLSRANHMKILRAMWDEDPDAIFPLIQAPTLYVLAEPRQRAASHSERSGSGPEAEPRDLTPTLSSEVREAEGNAGDAAPVDDFLAAKRQGAQTARERMTQAPSVEVIWARDTVHDIPLQRPEQLAAWIGDFLRRVAP